MAMMSHKINKMIFTMLRFFGAASLFWFGVLGGVALFIIVSFDCFLLL